VETDRGTSQSIRTTSRLATPGIFTVEGTGAGQGLAVLAGTTRLAMRQKYGVSAQPATTGDRIIVYATGVDSLSNVKVQIGGQQVAPLEIAASPDQPGVFQVTVAVPANIRLGDVPVSLSGTGYDGVTAQSNTVTIVLEDGAAQ
jgi:uncharacterized protein (TIGR03437 family)